MQSPGISARRTATVLALGLAGLLGVQGCIGDFALTQDLYRHNMRVDGKGAREAVFVTLLVVPMYELAVIGDMLIFNPIQFFSGENPWGDSTVEARP